MKTDKIELKLETGEVVVCRTAGEGKRLAYIAGGPGSFYFDLLAPLEKDYTFVTCDSIWTYKKNEDKEAKNISTVNKESIKQLDKLVVQALREKFKPEAIDGWGFSGPGALLFEEAFDCPELYDNLVGVGIGIIELDSTFEKTTKLFEEKASSVRKNFFKEYQEKHKKFLASVTDESTEQESLFKFFDVKPKPNRVNLKSHKRFVAESISLLPKLFSDISHPEIRRSQIITHWKHNAFGEHLDKEMQQHFFETIYPQLNSLDTIKKLAVQGKKILLIAGVDDYITPWTEEIISQIQGISDIRVEFIPHCGHFPYLETQEEFTKIITSFIDNQQSPVLI